MSRRILRAAMLAAFLGAAVAVGGALAENVDPGGTDAQYAWGENVGWINAEPSGEAGPGAQVSGSGVSGYMWGENIGWINLSCTNNGTCAQTEDFGVTNDGAGHLGGYAWGENVGWISFSCSNTPDSCDDTGDYGVDIDPGTGEWSGQAWGENIGWINFSHNQTASRVKSDDGDTIDGTADNCAFDANADQTNTDATYPISDALGDVCDPDDDNDSCTDARELAPNPMLGGDRDPLNPWDFYDVPAPPGAAIGDDGRSLLSPASQRNSIVSLIDVATVLTYVGRTSANPYYNADNNLDGAPDGHQLDRSASVDSLKSWRSGAPDGAISLLDVAVALVQVGTTCSSP